MNKEKFNKKCQELVDYEDKYSQDLKDIIKAFNRELNDNGYEIILSCWWLNFSEKDGEMQNSRINFNKGYRCSVSAQFQLKNADPDDGQGIGFQLIETITSYGLSLFNSSTFKKYSRKSFYKKIDIYFKKVKENGLEKTANTLLAL